MNYFRWFLTRPWEKIPHRIRYPHRVNEGDTILVDGKCVHEVRKSRTFASEAELFAFIQEERDHGSR